MTSDHWSDLADELESAGGDPDEVALMRRMATAKQQQEAQRQRAAGKVISERCGAKTRKGSPCLAGAMANGRCRNHGGCSTGPKTDAGRRRISEAQRSRWSNHKAEEGAIDDL